MTLVELLVAMSIGLVVVGAMAALYVRTSQSNRQLEALARLQENARYAFELLGYDIRLAGSTGCYTPVQATPANFVMSGSSYWWSNIGQPLYGQDETADSNAAGDSNFPSVAPGAYGSNALRGDTLVVLRANTEDRLGTVGSYDLGTGTVPFTDPTGTGFNKGSLLLLTDCKSQTVLFQKTGPADPASTAAIEHALGSGNPLSPGNCVAHLNVASNCTTTSSTSAMTGARLAALSANAYYLRASPYKYPNSNQYIPALYRQTLGTASGQVSTTAEELVSGVTDLQFSYGICVTDLNGNCTIKASDGVSEIASYKNASDMNSADWSKVLAVRVAITLESPDGSVRDDAQSFKLGNGTTLSDRRLRRSYTMTFGIRNRLLGNVASPTPSP